MDLKEKTVLITGASSGIGKETAIQFIKRGANAILVARRKERLEILENDLKKFNRSIMIYQCDVSDKFQVERMAKTVLGKFGSIDILVNNAGFAIYGHVNNLSIEDIQSQMETNYFGMVYCIKNFLPSMIANNSGHIVNVASVAASFGLPGIAPYCASKFAMLGFSEGLRHELTGTNIGITVVSPIMVRTEFFNNPSFKNMPKYSPTSLDPQTVANAIIKASNSPRLEIIVPSIVRGAVWMKNTFPFFIDPIVRRAFQRKLKSK